MKFSAMFVAALFVCATLSLQAQDNDNRPLVEQGNFALTFQMNGFGTFGVVGDNAGVTTQSGLNVPGFDSLVSGLFNGPAFPVLGIGVKTFVSDNFAIRGTLGVNYNGKTTTTKDTADNDIETTESKFVAAVAPGIEYHFIDAGPVSGYTGAIFSYTNGFVTSGPNDNQSTDRNSSFTLSALLGAEFFPWDNVSFGAEYTLGFTSTTTSTKIDDAVFDGPSFFALGTSAVAVRASLYIK